MFRTTSSALALTIALFGAGAASAQTLQEGSGQWNLVQIDAQAASDRGYTGEGVLIGVFDSGVDASVTDLIPNLSGLSFDVISGQPVLDDPDGHGTHVAGIIAAARNGSGVQGVAYDADLAVYRLVDTTSYAFDDQKLGETLIAAVGQGARFFNNSWGWNFYVGDFPAADVVRDLGGQIAGFRAVAEADGIMVFSTGNEYKTQPNLQAGMPVYVPELRDHWLAVTAVGPTGALASYANHCGAAAQWCLAAPGGEITTGNFADQILSTGANGGIGGSGLDIKSGTSMAAPHVTGAVAIAAQMYPQASAHALTRLILTTAVDLGDPGVDNVYGWGLLNVGNLARTRDAYAASTFANGLWGAQDAQTLVMDSIAERSQVGPMRTAWVSLSGRQGRHDASVDGPAARTDGLALVGGFDIVNRGDAVLGLALAHSQADFNEVDRRNGGTVDATTLALYGGLSRGPVFAEASVGGDVRDYRFRRGAVAGTEGTVLENSLDGRVKTDGHGAFAAARAGVVFATGGLVIRPYVYGRAARQQIDGFTEQGADVFSLTAEDQSVDRFEAGPGLTLTLTPRSVGSAALGADIDVRHGFVSGDQDFAFDTDLLGAPITGRIVEPGDVTTVSAGVSLGLGENVDLSLRGVWSEADRADGKGVSASFRLLF